MLQKNKLYNILDLNLPGQEMTTGHGPIIVALPKQLSPLLFASGMVQFLDLDLVPPGPQSTEHVPQFSHGAQFPCTVDKRISLYYFVFEL